MSAVKTLVPVPAGTTDASRNVRGLFAAATSRTSAHSAIRGDETESSFQSLLSQATQHTDRPFASAVQSATDSQSKESRKASETTSRASDRSRQTEKKKRSERPEDADDGQAVEEQNVRTEEGEQAQETGDDVDATEETSSGETEATGEGGDTSGESEGAAEAEASTADQQDGGDVPAKPADETAAKGSAAPAAQLLRQLGQMANNAAPVQANVVASTASKPSDSAVRDSSRVRSPQVEAQATSAQAESQPTQPAESKGKRLRAEGLSQTALYSTQSKSPEAGRAVEPAQAAPSEPSAADELVRLLAVAAGLADSGTGEQEESRAASSPDRPQRSGAQQAPSTDAAAAQAKAGAIGVETRPTTSASARPAESFVQVMAQSEAASGGASKDISRVADLVRANVGSRNSTITIRLDPPELGQIQLHARLRDDVLSVQVEAETAAARDLLQSRLDDLRQALDRHGIRMDRFDVEPRPVSQSSNERGTSDRGSSWQQQSTDGGLAGQWQQQDSSSNSAHGGEGGSAPFGDADALREMAAAGAQADLATEKTGGVASVAAGAAGASVNVLA